MTDTGLFPVRNPELDFIIDYTPFNDAHDKFTVQDLQETGSEDDWDDIPTIRIDVPEAIRSRKTGKE